jgi:hypothetical protein
VFVFVCFRWSVKAAVIVWVPSLPGVFSAPSLNWRHRLGTVVTWCLLRAFADRTFAAFVV